jgi:O-antigen/teichoic acid export membrane protein
VHITSAIKNIAKKILPEWILVRITHPGFRKYFKNTGWLFVGRAASLAASFFVGVYVARYLGPEQYGILNYVISFVGVFGFIAALGLDGILYRELISRPQDNNVLLGTSFILRLAGGAFALALAVMMSLILHGWSEITFFVFLYSLTFLFQSFSVIDILFQSEVASANSVKVQLFSYALSSILKILCISFGLGLTWFIVVYVLDAFVIAAGFVFFSLKFKGRLLLSLKHFERSTAYFLLKNSWPLILSSAFLLVYNRIDQVMIGRMIDNEAVGQYAVAVRISELWVFLPGIITNSVIPALVHAKDAGLDFYKERLKKLYFLIFYLSLSISFAVSLSAKLMISTLFGDAFQGAIVPTRIYVWSGIASALGYTISQCLIIENHIKISFYTNLIGMVSNVILNLFLIQKYGIIGAAIATLISYFLVVFATLLFKETRGHSVLIMKSLILR